jgi:FkbM family methyltransferase
MHAAKSLLKAILPNRTRAAAWRANRRLKMRGRPFPFLVAHALAGDTLNCCIAFNRYGGYCVPLSGRQRPAVRHVLAGEVWEAASIEFIASRCGRGDIVHAGAYFGDFLPALSRALAEAAQVWAFEPNRESYRCARITIDINRLANVRIMHAAVGETADTLDLVTGEDGTALGGASHVAPRAVMAPRPSGARTEQTRIVAIDDIVPEARAISVMQLDIEGYEQKALRGALRTIRRCRPILLLETLPEEGWMTRHLVPLGYRQEAMVADNFVLSCTA